MCVFFFNKRFVISSTIGKFASRYQKCQNVSENICSRGRETQKHFVHLPASHVTAVAFCLHCSYWLASIKSLGSFPVVSQFSLAGDWNSRTPPRNIYWRCSLSCFVLMFLCLQSWGQGVISVTCLLCFCSICLLLHSWKKKSQEHAYISVKYVWAPLCARGQMCVLCAPYTHSGSSLTAFRLWEQWRGWKARADSSHLGPQ